MSCLRMLRKSALIAVAAILLLAWGCISAQAANWTIQTTPNGTSAEHSALYDISCEPESISVCTAVGSQTVGGVSSPYAQMLGGKGWLNQTVENPIGATAGELQANHCLSKTSCVAAGSYTTASGTFSLIEAWNGGSWTIQPSPNPVGATETKLKGISCNVITACIAVGYSNAVGKWATAMRGNSGSWSLQTMPKPAEALSSELHGVDCTAPTSCTAVGSYTVSGGANWAMAARWNGTEWTLQSVPKPAESKKSTLLDISCSDSTHCTAVGGYVNSSGVQVTFVQRWDTTTWTQQTSFNPTGSSNSVLQNVSCDDRYSCVAVGDWLNAGTWRPMALRWDSLSWPLDSVAMPTGSTFGLLEGVSCRITCRAVGWYTNAEGKNRTLAEARETPSWTQGTIAAPSASSLSGVNCYAESSCMAAGIGANSATAFLGGVTWTELTPPKPAEVTFSQLRDASCLAEGGTCTAVGVYVKGGIEKPYAVRRVESGVWTLYNPLPLPAGASSAALNDVSCTSAVACTAVGDFKNAEGLPRTYVLRWNGISWTVQSSPNEATGEEDVLTSVSCASSTSCVAVGYVRLTTGVDLPLIEVWNGVSWTIQGAPLPTGGVEGKLFGVSCPSATGCMAVGRYWDKFAGHTFATEWFGASWAPAKSPRPAFAQGSHFEDVSCMAGISQCVAVGSYFVSGGTKTFAASRQKVMWTAHLTPSPNASSNFLLGVSCLSITTCRGVGYAGEGNLAATYP